MVQQHNLFFCPSGNVIHLASHSHSIPLPAEPSLHWPFPRSPLTNMVCHMFRPFSFLCIFSDLGEYVSGKGVTKHPRERERERERERWGGREGGRGARAARPPPPRAGAVCALHPRKLRSVSGSVHPHHGTCRQSQAFCTPIMKFADSLRRRWTTCNRQHRSQALSPHSTPCHGFRPLPEDLVNTWAVTRFVPRSTGFSSLFALEVCT